MLANRGDTIEGTGTIGATGMSIENNSSSTIEASGGALTLFGTPGSSGYASFGDGISNAGSLIATKGSTLDLNAATYSPGQLIAESGGHVVANDAVYGVGVTNLQGNGSVEFKAENDTDVHFASGADATLKVDDPASFFGTIYGFGEGDSIDLTNVTYNSSLTVNSSDFGSLDGNLVLMNGTTVENAGLWMEGHYSAAYLTAHDLKWSVSAIDSAVPADGVKVTLVSTIPA